MDSVTKCTLLDHVRLGEAKLISIILRYIHHPITVITTREMVNAKMITFEEYNRHWYNMWSELYCRSLRDSNFSDLKEYRVVDYGTIFCITAGSRQNRIYATQEAFTNSKILGSTLEDVWELMDRWKCDVYKSLEGTDGEDYILSEDEDCFSKGADGRISDNSEEECTVEDDLYIKYENVEYLNDRGKYVITSRLIESEIPKRDIFMARSKEEPCSIDHEVAFLFAHYTQHYKSLDWCPIILEETARFVNTWFLHENGYDDGKNYFIKQLIRYEVKDLLPIFYIFTENHYFDCCEAFISQLPDEPELFKQIYLKGFQLYPEPFDIMFQDEEPVALFHECYTTNNTCYMEILAKEFLKKGWKFSLNEATDIFYGLKLSSKMFKVVTSMIETKDVDNIHLCVELNYLKGFKKELKKKDRFEEKFLLQLVKNFLTHSCYESFSLALFKHLIKKDIQLKKYISAGYGSDSQKLTRLYILVLNKSCLPDLFDDMGCYRTSSYDLDHDQLRSVIKHSSRSLNGTICEELFLSDLKEECRIFMLKEKPSLITLIRLKHGLSVSTMLGYKDIPIKVLNRCFRKNISNIDTVKLFIKDGRVDVSMKNNLALREARKSGNTKLSTLLLNDKRVMRLEKKSEKK